MTSAGVVLAAGASRRMGRAKATLLVKPHVCLADYQARLLNAAGCEPVVTVLGADADNIAAQLQTPHLVRNPDWAQGRLTSVRAGLRAVCAARPSVAGIILLPVDAAFIRLESVRQLLYAAEQGSATVVRPTHQGTAGYLVWIARSLVDELCDPALPADTPLNAYLAARTQELAVDDAAILHNANTPGEWDRLRRSPDGHWWDGTVQRVGDGA